MLSLKWLLKLDHASAQSVKRFWRAYWGLPMIDPEAGIEIVILPDGDKLRLLLDVADYATSDAIKQALPALMAWRKALTAWQGANEDDRNTKAMIRARLADRHQRGESYQELADWVNNAVLALLTVDSDPTNLPVVVIQLLRSLGMADDEIQTECTAIIANLRAGEPGFTRDPRMKAGPVSRARVVEALRPWRKGSCGKK